MDLYRWAPKIEARPLGYLDASQNRYLKANLTLVIDIRPSLSSALRPSLAESLSKHRLLSGLVFKVGHNQLN